MFVISYVNACNLHMAVPLKPIMPSVQVAVLFMFSVYFFSLFSFHIRVDQIIMKDMLVGTFGRNIHNVKYCFESNVICDPSVW